MGLRRDGIGGNHLNLRQSYRFRDRMASFQDPFHDFSSPKDMALRGHSTTHRPHPLQ